MGLNLCQHRDQPWLAQATTLFGVVKEFRRPSVTVVVVGDVDVVVVLVVVVVGVVAALLLLCENSLEGEKERRRERERERDEKPNKGTTLLCGVPGHVCGQHAYRHRSADNSPWTEVGRR